MRLQTTWTLLAGPLFLGMWGCQGESQPDTQTSAIAEIERLGGRFQADWKGSDRPVIGVYLEKTPVTDADLEYLKGLTNLQVLRLADTQVTDAGLQHLKGLTRLQWLWLSGTQVTDAGLEHLKAVTGLQKLFLSDTQITDAGLGHLKELTNLQYVSLIGSQVTEEGVKKLHEALPDCTIQH